MEGCTLRSQKADLRLNRAYERIWPGSARRGRAQIHGPRSALDSFGHFQGVIHLNAEVPHRRFQLGVAEQKLDRPLEGIRGANN